MTNSRFSYGKLLRYANEGIPLKEVADRLGMTKRGVLGCLHKQHRLSGTRLPEGVLFLYADQYYSRTRSGKRDGMRSGMAALEGTGNVTGVDCGLSYVRYTVDAPPGADEVAGLIRPPLRDMAKECLGRRMKLECRPASENVVEVTMDGGHYAPLGAKVAISWFMQALSDRLTGVLVQERELASAGA